MGVEIGLPRQIRDAQLAHVVADAIVRAHLTTMYRLNIEYDVLPRESEILHLKFWATAFELLKERKAIYFETEGKNKGCWVMPSSAFREGSTDEDDSKVIVRSNGTVTYAEEMQVDSALGLGLATLLGACLAAGTAFAQPGPQGGPDWNGEVKPGGKTEAVDAFVAELRERFQLPVHLEDESFTSSKASDALRQRGSKKRSTRDWMRAKAEIDRVAACYILQDWLDREGAGS